MKPIEMEGGRFKKLARCMMDPCSSWGIGVRRGGFVRIFADKHFGYTDMRRYYSHLMR